MSMLKQVKNHKIRAVKTVALYIAFIAIGMATSIVGPTMLDLQIMTKTDLNLISYILPARTAGLLIGTILMGAIYPYVNFQLTTALLLLSKTVAYIGVPFIRSYQLLLGVFITNGLTAGMVDAGCNIHMLDIWGKETTAFMQGLHLFFGVGALLTPLFCEPFLLQSQPIEIVTIGNRTFDAGQYSPDQVQLYWPYSIAGIVFFVAGIIFFVLFFLHPDSTPHPSRTSPESLPECDKPSSSVDQSVYPDKDVSFRICKFIAIGLMMIFMALFYGLEMVYGSYLATFAVISDLKLSKSTGAYVSSVYWATFSFVRLSTVAYIKFVGNELNVVINLIVTMIGVAFLYPLGGSSEWSLWTGTAFIGIGTSSMFACAFGYLEDYFPVSSKIGSLYTISMAAGECVIPVFIAYYIATDPEIFLDVVLACVLLMAVTFSGVVIICRLKLKVKE